MCGRGAVQRGRPGGCLHLREAWLCLWSAPGTVIRGVPASWVLEVLGQRCQKCGLIFGVSLCGDRAWTP